MTRARTFNTYLSATALSFVAGLAVYFGWRFGVVPELLYRTGLLQSTTSLELFLGPVPVSAIALVACSLAFGLTINSIELRRSWQYLLAGLVVMCSASLSASRFFGLELLITPLLLSSSFALLLVQVNRLWQLDLQLLNTLFSSPITAAESGPGADQRLMSGLKLLNTFLRLNEAVVFQLDESNSFEAVARFKGSAQKALDNSRNSVWREGVNLCERAAASGKLVNQTTGDANNQQLRFPCFTKTKSPACC